jgi:hypothetical protein
MILDAILLTLVEIASTEQRGVAILLEMRITQGDGTFNSILSRSICYWTFQVSYSLF